ncbi:MAG: hypothetical protein QF724_10275 [Planctomycetota bacterium]|nr:hypothetical protein [Planctomycetota bacterium]
MRWVFAALLLLGGATGCGRGGDDVLAGGGGASGGGASGGVQAAAPGGYTMTGNSFEESGWEGLHWEVGGAVAGSQPGLEVEAVYGERHAELGGALAAEILRRLPIGTEDTEPRIGDEVEACVWVRLGDDVPLGSVANPDLFVEVQLLGWVAGTALETAWPLASARWTPIVGDGGYWRLLHTTPVGVGVLDAPATHLIMRVKKTLPGTVDLDYAQAGTNGSVNGNPGRLVTATYVGWFRSPHAVEATGSAATPRELWRNWAWLTPPYGEPDYTELFHNPDCASSATCLRSNGRRNGATSEEWGPGSLPLIGAYDSRDLDVIGYHVDLARAVGVDALVFDSLGHALAEQQAAQSGEAPLEETALLRLFDAAETAGDTKVALMYEPKGHMSGWVLGEADFAARKAGILADLLWFVETLGRRRALLTVDGDIVLHIFDPYAPLIGGGAGDPPALTDGDWRELVDAVVAATGRGLFLVSTLAPPDSGAPHADLFGGFLRWKLVEPALLRYGTWQDFKDRIPSWPPPAVTNIDSFAASSNALAVDWAAQDPASRLAVSVAWPGFDDSGVGGWGAPNINGTDGQPIRVRVVDPLFDQNGQSVFFERTLSAAAASGAAWLHLSTWNDWNEQTALEPTWNEGLVQAFLAGTAPDPADVAASLGRVTLAQERAAAFKGQPGVGLAKRARLSEIVEDRVLAAWTDAAVVLYD